MGQRIAAIAVLIIAGAIVADLVTHPEGTGKVFTGLANLWSTSMNAVLGQPSKGAA